MVNFKVQRYKFSDLDNKEKFLYNGEVYAKTDRLQPELSETGFFNAIGKFSLACIPEDQYVSPVGTLTIRDIKVTETFIHNDEPFIKTVGETDIATNLLTGIQTKFNRDVFITPCNIDIQAKF